MTTTPPDSRVRAATAWLVRVTSDNAAGAVYGTVMIGVLLAAERAQHEGYGTTIGAALIVLAVYWLASLYTYVLGTRLRTRAPLTAAVIWRSCIYELPLIEGALVPLLVLVIAWAAGAGVASGVTAAIWTAAVSLVVLEVVAGWRSGLPAGRLWLQAAAGALIGAAIIALKLVLK